MTEREWNIFGHEFISLDKDYELVAEMTKDTRTTKALIVISPRTEKLVPILEVE